MSAVDRAADCIRHPLVLGMMFVWGLNDHLLKVEFGNAVTGKLSDVAGLVVVPLIPVSAYALVCDTLGRPPRHTRSVLLLSTVLVGVLFAGINLDVAWGEAYRQALACAQWPFRLVAGWVGGQSVQGLTPLVHTVDPTDLIALPALAIPWWVVRRRA